MPYFSTKPVRFEARQFTVSTWQEVTDWCGGRFRQHGEVSRSTGQRFSVQKLSLHVTKAGNGADAIAEETDWVCYSEEDEWFVTSDKVLRESCLPIDDQPQMGQTLVLGKRVFGYDPASGPDGPVAYRDPDGTVGFLR